MDLISPFLILTFTLFQWIVLSSSYFAYPIAKEGCQDHCGNVSIPFPFGTRKGCYLQKHFFIDCSNPAKPFLGDGVSDDSFINVVEIYVEGQLRVLYPASYYCYDPKTDNPYIYFEPNMTLSTVMAFNDTANMFTVIGCKTYGIVRGQANGRTYTTGCLSICDYKSDVQSGPCSGVGCSQTSIPNGAWQINISVDVFENYSSVWEYNPCSYAFVVETGEFNFSSKNLTNIDKNYSAPVIIDWVIEYNVMCKTAKTSSSYACKAKYSECVDVPGLGYHCRCKNGFEGNPYLSSNSCQDINECAIWDISICGSNSRCNNILGDYRCDCDQGYRRVSDLDYCIEDVQSKKPNYWLPIYAAIGSCIVLVVLSYFCYSKLMRRKEHRTREEYFKKNGGLLLQEKLNSSQRDANNLSVRIFTVEELQKATNDFDEKKIIGQGGFGTVYIGELIDGTIVAIKKSKGIDQRGVEQFINEVILLSQINNRNVVKLFGCYLETSIPLLIYEFINNGTLLDHLNGMIRNHATNLSWNIRVQIASQVVGVLFYLHSCATTKIIHRDIKSSNILLDQDYVAKVADFGISRLVLMDENQLSTIVQGTPELITAKKVFSVDRPEAERFLATYFLYQLNNNNLLGVLDHNMACNNEVFEQINEVAMIAKRCISVKGEDRPYMKEVLRDLEKLLEIQGSNVVERDSEKQRGVFDDKQHSRACTSSHGHSYTFASSDIFPVTTSTVEHILPVSD